MAPMPNDNTAGFWTDAVQAAERLEGTFVMDRDNVVYIQRIDELDAVFNDPLGKQPQERKPLASEDWSNFRKLPPLGWHNIDYAPGRPFKRFTGAVYLRRRALRTRTHGLNGNNVNVMTFFQAPGQLTVDRNIPLAQVFGDPLFKDPAKYPRFEEAFDLLRPNDSAALSNKFALAQDGDGLTWLYRKRQKIGLVPDNGSLLLLRSAKYYVEDVQANAHTLPVNVKEL
jgi:hypothetical protein